MGSNWKLTVVEANLAFQDGRTTVLLSLIRKHVFFTRDGCLVAFMNEENSMLGFDKEYWRVAFEEIFVDG